MGSSLFHVEVFYDVGPVAHIDHGVKPISRDVLGGQMTAVQLLLLQTVPVIDHSEKESERERATHVGGRASLSKKA